MILFHGTPADDTKLASILRDGLRGIDRGWVGCLVGHARPSFLSTSPVAGRGGDPVSFALGWPWPVSLVHRPPGYIFVIDLPKPEHGRILTALRNRDLEDWFVARDAKAWMSSNDHFWALHEIARRVAPDFETARALLVPRFHTIDKALAAPDLTIERWRGFVFEYTAARTDKDLARVERKYRITCSDPSLRHCELCTANLVDYVYEVRGFPDLRLHGRYGSLDVCAEKPGLATLLRVVAAYTDGLAPAELARLRAASAKWGNDFWERLERWARPDPARLPRVYRPGFGAAPASEDLRHSDTQVLVDGVGPELILGAIQISENGRLLPGIRPNRRRGETLAAKLWSLAHALADEHRGAPRIVRP